MQLRGVWNFRKDKFRQEPGKSFIILGKGEISSDDYSCFDLGKK